MAGEAAADGGQGHEHAAFLAHHFETPKQQFESGKLGMWLFLSTEVLFFGGLFCAYAVYRANHPEIFLYAHKYLDSWLGGINTAFLICSSLTMAWAVHCAQRGQQKRLVQMLALTLLFGCCFLGVKYVEYSHKWRDGLLWGTRFDPAYAPGEHGHGAEPHGGQGSADVQQSEAAGHDPQAGGGAGSSEPEGDAAAAAADAGPAGGPAVERTTLPEPGRGPSGLAVRPGRSGEPVGHGILERPSNVHIFFGIYFTMTGLHLLHVLAGMAVIGWILVRSAKGHFGPDYFTPVDLVGLYWHLVDLIWIYLFPLLYLIH